MHIPSSEGCFPAANIARTVDDLASPPGNTPSTIPEPPSKKSKLHRGQNKGRKFANTEETVQLCFKTARAELCSSEDCKASHDVDSYLEAKAADLPGTCPAMTQASSCMAGLRCRWLSSHVQNPQNTAPQLTDAVQNALSKDVMIQLRRKEYDFPRSEQYLKDLAAEDAAEHLAADTKVRVRPCDKRRLVWRNTRILAPLTTTGNLPFRQLCRSYGADVTYSEMAVSIPLLNGAASEWALTRSHRSERDIRHGRQGLFGVQLAGAKTNVVSKAAEVLSEQLGATLDFIDLNCGCPIDLIYKTGAGSALLDNQGKLLKMLRGMALVTGELPITCKIRTGVSDKKATAGKLLAKLQAQASVSMVTLHGRSRQQRYSRAADWTYIAECANQIKAYHKVSDDQDLRGDNAENGHQERLAFVGNGDIYTYEDWNRNMLADLDSCMIGRGALIKPWIFEEIDAQQHLDKSSSERLEMLKQFCHNGVSYFGTDQMGVDKTRRFFLEFMSFHHRYTPVGLLDNKPLPMNERAPSWLGRDALECQLGSTDSRDWIKLSEIFLGRAPETFKFIPKHKANMVEGEG